MANRNCPKCGQVDKVTKVSAIVADQTSTSSGMARTYVAEKDYGHWDSAPYSGTQISNLARKLARPNPPEPPSKGGIRNAILAGLVILLCGVTYVTVVIESFRKVWRSQPKKLFCWSGSLEFSSLLVGQLSFGITLTILRKKGQWKT